MDSEILPTTKTVSAGIMNVFPFIFLYILLNHQEQGEQKCENDKLYGYIPNKSKQLNSKYRLYILIAAVIALLIKSKTNETIEHSFVLLSYAIGLKTAIHFMSPCIPKAEFTNITIICVLLNMIYFNIIPNEHMTGGYLASFIYSLYLISTRQTTTGNVIIDNTIAHFIFLYIKFLH